jgi:hypothetical protein
MVLKEAHKEKVKLRMRKHSQLKKRVHTIGKKSIFLKILEETEYAVVNKKGQKEKKR